MKIPGSRTARPPRNRRKATGRPPRASSDISTQGETGGVSPWLWGGIVAAVVVLAGIEIVARGLERLAGGGTGLYFYLKKKKSM